MKMKEMGPRSGVYPWYSLWIRQRVQECRSGAMQKILTEIDLQQFVCNNILGRWETKHVPVQLDMYSFMPNAYEWIPLTFKIQTTHDMTMSRPCTTLQLLNVWLNSTWILERSAYFCPEKNSFCGFPFKFSEKIVFEQVYKVQLAINLEESKMLPINLKSVLMKFHTWHSPKGYTVVSHIKANKNRYKNLPKPWAVMGINKQTHPVSSTVNTRLYSILNNLQQ